MGVFMSLWDVHAEAIKEVMLGCTREQPPTLSVRQCKWNHTCLCDCSHSGWTRLLEQQFLRVLRPRQVDHHVIGEVAGRHRSQACVGRRLASARVGAAEQQRLLQVLALLCAPPFALQQGRWVMYFR